MSLKFNNHKNIYASTFSSLLLFDENSNQKYIWNWTVEIFFLSFPEKLFWEIEFSVSFKAHWQGRKKKEWKKFEKKTKTQYNRKASYISKTPTLAWHVLSKRGNRSRMTSQSFHRQKPKVRRLSMMNQLYATIKLHSFPIELFSFLYDYFFMSSRTANELGFLEIDF